jgi:hypothetical protein
MITCNIEAGKCLEFHNCFPQGVSCYDCTRAWIPNLRIQVAELGQVDLKKTKHYRVLIKNWNQVCTLLLGLPSYLQYISTKLKPSMYTTFGTAQLPSVYLHKIETNYVHYLWDCPATFSISPQNWNQLCTLLLGLLLTHLIYPDISDGIHQKLVEFSRRQCTWIGALLVLNFMIY